MDTPDDDDAHTLRPTRGLSKALLRRVALLTVADTIDGILGSGHSLGDMRDNSHRDLGLPAVTNALDNDRYYDELQTIRRRLLQLAGISEETDA